MKNCYKMKFLLLALVLTVCGIQKSFAQYITTVAGQYTGDGGSATAAALISLEGMAVDTNGNAYICDALNNQVRKISPTGTITVFAGTGAYGYTGDGAAATAATLNQPAGVAADRRGNIYIAEKGNNCVRRVSATGVIRTFAGNGTGGYSGDGGQATAASLLTPTSVCVDVSNNVYIADSYNNAVRKVNSSGIISTFAGTGTSGYSGDNGSATAATLNSPVAVTVDSSGNVFIADFYNNCVRKVTAGVITTYAGTGTSGFAGDGSAATAAKLNGPTDVLVSRGGQLFIADNSNNRIRKVSASGIISTFAGNGTTGFSGDNGLATAATIASAYKMALDKLGNIYLNNSNASFEFMNLRVRKINTNDTITTVAGNGGYYGDGSAASTASFHLPSGVTTDYAGNVYVADEFNARVRKISTAGSISTVAGNGTAGFSGDGAAAVSAQLDHPRRVFADRAGNLFICDSRNHRIRKVTPAGTITTVAGSGSSGFSGDGGPATAATLSSPGDMTVDRNGNIYIADKLNNRIRKVDATTTNISTIAGTGSAGFSGDNGAAVSATFNFLDGIAVDTSGNVYVSDAANHRIRKISTANIVTTIAGNGTAGTSGNGGPATAAEIGTPAGLYCDTTGYLYISDAIGFVRKVNLATGVISAVAGGGNVSLQFGDGGPATAGFLSYPQAVCADRSGGIFIADAFNFRVRAVPSCPLPVVGDITGRRSVCISDSTLFADTTLRGTWTSSDTSVAKIGATGRVRGISSGNVIITYSKTTICGTSLDTFTMVVDARPVMGSISGSTNVCVGSLDTLTASISGGTWSSSASTIATISSTGIVSGIARGATNISYSVTTGCGSIVDTMRLTVSVVPVSGTTRGSRTLCVSDTAIYTTTATAGGTWGTTVPGVATINASGRVTALSAGTTIILYVNANPCGYVLDTFLVTVLPRAVSGTISGNNVMCVRTADTVTTTGLYGAWNSSAPSVATVANDGTIYGASVGTTVISYTVSNACSSSTDTMMVNVIAAPSPATITGRTSFCFGTRDTLSVSPTGGRWFSLSSSVATISTAGIAFGSSAGTAIISYSLSNLCGTVNDTIALTVIPLPVSGTVSGPSQVCVGANITMRTTGSGGTWSATPGSIASISTGGILRGINTGNVIVSYTFTNACGSATDTQMVTVNTVAPAGLISAPPFLCTGVLANLTETTSGGLWISSNPAIATVSPTGSVTPLAAGTFIIAYQKDNVCGRVTDSLSLTVRLSPNAGILTGRNWVCEGGGFTLLRPSVTGGAWSSTASSIATVNVSGVVSGVVPGSATISYTVVNTCGTAAATFPVTVRPIPVPGVISGPDTVRSGSPVTFTETVGGGVWTSAIPTIATISAGGVITAVTSGATTITYRVTDSCGSVTATKGIYSIVPTGVHGLSANEHNVLVTPNPTTGLLTVELSGVTASYTVLVTDITGKSILQQAVAGGSTSIDLSVFPSGLYLIKVVTADGSYQEKVIKE